MLGVSHVGTGLLAGLVTAPLMQSQGWPAQVAWVAVAGGTALLPDLDHPQASAARMWGPLSWSLSKLTHTAARGHRQGTHDLLLAPLLFGGIVALASLHRVTLTAVLALILGLTLCALALVGVGRTVGAANLAASIAGAWWITGHLDPAVLVHLPLAVALGTVVHIAGDLITEGGIPVPVVWLFGTRRRLTLSLFTTGGIVERVVIAPAVLLLFVWALSWRTGIGVDDVHRSVAEWSRTFHPAT